MTNGFKVGQRVEVVASGERGEVRRVDVGARPHVYDVRLEGSHATHRFYGDWLRAILPAVPAEPKQRAWRANSSRRGRAAYLEPLPATDETTPLGRLDQIADIIFDGGFKSSRDTVIDIEKVLLEFGYEPTPNVQVFTVTLETPRPASGTDIARILGQALASDVAVTVTKQ